MRWLISSLGPAARWPMNRSKPARIASVMVAASVPNVSSAAIVVRTAKPAIQSRRRPIGYHSSVGEAGAPPSLDGAASATGRPSRARCPSHQAGSAIVMAKVMHRGRPKTAPRPVAAVIPPMVDASGPHPSATTISGSGAK